MKIDVLPNGAWLLNFFRLLRLTHIMLMMLMQGDRVTQYRELVYKSGSWLRSVVERGRHVRPIPLSGVGADYHRTC